MSTQAVEERRGSIEFPPEDYRDDRTEESFQLFAISEQKAAEFTGCVDALSRILARMGGMMASMQRRMDELEERQAAVTVSHADVKRIQALIRSRADVICGKYGLEDPESRKVFRAAIKKDVLRRCAAADLHDIPQAMRGAVDRQIDGWTNIRLVMERRERP